MGLSRAPTVFVLLVVGCATTGGQGEERYGGDIDATPDMDVLPELDVARKKLGERMRFAWKLVRESFALKSPEPPQDATVAQLESWSDTTLARWLEKKNARVEAARKELNAAAKENHRQRILAGALVGLMYEDVARVLLSVPVPDEIRTEPEIAKIFREVVNFQAKPYVQHARRAYRACAANAVRPRSMHHWSQFCGGRREELPRIGDSGVQEGTVVTVEVEP